MLVRSPNAELQRIVVSEGLTTQGSCFGRHGGPVAVDEDGPDQGNDGEESGDEDHGGEPSHGDVSTSVDELRRALCKHDPAMWEVLDCNEAINAEVLKVWAECSQEAVLRYVAGHPRTPPQIVELLVQRATRLVAEQILHRSDITSSVIRALTAKELLRIAFEPDKQDRLGLFKRDSLPAQLIEVLAADAEADVRRHVVFIPAPIPTPSGCLPVTRVGRSANWSPTAPAPLVMRCRSLLPTTTSG